MTDLVKLYNPANASALTPEEIEGLQSLSSAEIKQLAVAYPNVTMQRAYLLIIDNTKPVNKQLPALSSFENLWNLREKNGLRQYVAYAFKGAYKPVKTVKGTRNEVVDLSDSELLSLPGFKTGNTDNPGVEVEIVKLESLPDAELPEEEDIYDAVAQYRKDHQDGDKIKEAQEDFKQKT